MGGTSSRSPPGRADELARALAGEEGEKLRAVIRRLVGSQQTMEDVMQQACESFLQYPQAIREPKAMLGRIARNQALDYLRWKRRRSEIALDGVQAEPVAHLWSLESAEAWEQFDRRFAAVLAAATADERELIDRHYLQGMNVEQIAAKEGITSKRVKKRISRMLHRFRIAMIGEDICRGDLE